MTSESTTGPYGRSLETGAAVVTGIFLFAAAMMIVDGIFHIIQGIAALLDDGYFQTAENYAFDIDITAWGWLHLISGIFLAVAGVGLLSGAIWARLLALFIVVVSAMVNFVFIPYAPIWSIVQLAIDGVIVWAILTMPDFDDDWTT